MATTINEISEWFDEGVKQKATHMVIVCDSFSYEDYPVFCMSEEDARKKIKNPGEMQRIMEVYKLSSDKSTQLSKYRNFEI